MGRQIWLLRHGEAEPHGATEDAMRTLTARGERQAAAAGAALARLGVEFDACYTSPKIRARDTARLACESLGVDPVEIDGIAEDFDVDLALELTNAHSEDDDARVLFVGHNPDFAQIVHDMTGAAVDFKKGGVACVRVTSGRQGDLLALLRPRELESLAVGK